MGKTVKQIAEEIGVSKQAVHQKRKNPALATVLQPFTETIDGVVYIAPEGEKLLKQAFSKTDGTGRKPVDENAFTEVDGGVDAPEHPLYAILREELAAKNRQIEQLQAQLAEQTQINKELAQSINADRRNELAGTMQQLLSDGVPASVDDGPAEVVEVAPEPSEQVTPAKRRFWAWLWKK